MMFLIASVISTSTFLVQSNAATLPSNALNRWTWNKTPLSLNVRGGESVVQTVSSTSKPRRLLIDDDIGTSTSSAPKMKKRRKKKSSSSSSSLKKGSRDGVTSSTPIKTSSSTSSAAAKVGTSTASTASTIGTKSKSQTTTTTVASGVPTSSEIESTTTSTKESSETKTSSSSLDKMPSIFQPEESIYDKYAACLAATEGLRRIRDSKVPKKTPFRSAVNVDAERSTGWKSFLKGDSSSTSSSTTTSATSASATSEKLTKKEKALLAIEQQKEEYKRACAEYVFNSSKVVKALGLSVSQFNQLGREIRKNGPLKERVMEQAYLYRMASTIKFDKIPLIEDPNSKKLLQSHKRRRVQMFVKSITEIEDLRSEQMERLKRALNIDKLPPHINLCDPNVLPLLSPKVRAVIEAFPLQAEVIVKKYGLNSDEFNQMLEETRGNPIFRWRVERFQKKSNENDEEGSSSGKKATKIGKKNDQFGLGDMI